MGAMYEFHHKWVPLQILAIGISIWMMWVGVYSRPGVCWSGLFCDLFLAYIVCTIGTFVFCVSTFSLLYMSFSKVW